MTGRLTARAAAWDTKFGDDMPAYAATGERTEAILSRLRRSPTYARDIDSLPAQSHRSRPETMAAFLQQMDARYGGVTRWLTDHGLGTRELNQLRAKLRPANLT